MALEKDSSLVLSMATRVTGEPQGCSVTNRLTAFSESDHRVRDA
jgi:hypothetical protein